MEIRPISLRAANAYVQEHHRHSGPTRGWKFGVALYHGDALCGVGIAGRPVSRVLDDGQTLEILRVCTIGAANGCSMIYGALRKAGVALGYQRVVTYTLADEPGTSLRAAGFHTARDVDAKSWTTPSRPRDDHHEIRARMRWDWP